MSNVYRLQVPPYPTEKVYGPLLECPQCHAHAMACALCRDTRTDRVYGETCGGTCTGHFYDGKHFLTFTRNTATSRVCSPTHRVRFGFLWLRQCEESGTHYHQRCERCGWQGISHVEGT